MKVSKKSHVKIGDKVQIIAGTQKGIIGNINSILKKKSIVYIDGIEPRLKKNTKANSSTDSENLLLELQIPIHISNIMLWDTKSNEASRIGYKMIENAKKRYFKKSGNVL